jgi:hypothetical protein
VLNAMNRDARVQSIEVVQISGTGP